MTPTAATTCFFTTVRCTASRSQFFAFLGTAGLRMAPEAELTFAGDLVAQIASKHARHQAGFLKAVEDRKLQIVKTPAPRSFDLTTDTTKIIEVSNGSVVASDPCEGAYSSSLSD